ncbi:MAG: PorT family protein [Saprospiraceae bacterium]|nr:PorT family protein [Saprospiraceae bacterium]
MKKFKFFFAVLLLAAIAQISFAQGLGIRGGVNFQNLNGKDANGDKLENDLLIGYHAGVTGEFSIAPDFYLQPGLLFSTKGAKTSQDIFGQTAESSLRVGYLEVPVHFLYKPLLGEGHLILGFGPYVGVGLTGKGKLDYAGNSQEFDVKFENKINGSTNDDYAYVRRFDMGGNLFFGYELANGLYFQFNTQLGLINISPEVEGATKDETKTNNTGFGLSVGYRLGEKG